LRVGCEEGYFKQGGLKLAPQTNQKVVGGDPAIFLSKACSPQISGTASKNSEFEAKNKACFASWEQSTVS